MALIFRGSTECSICGKVISAEDDIVATTHFVAGQNDPLSRFSDSGMHRACFMDWPLRQSFVDRYNATMGQITWGNGSRQTMLPSGDIESTPPDPALVAAFEANLAELRRGAAEQRQSAPIPCPHCGEPLRTPLAKQCLSCGMDWHDPANVVRRGR